MKRLVTSVMSASGGALCASDFCVTHNWKPIIGGLLICIAVLIHCYWTEEE